MANVTLEPPAKTLARPHDIRLSYWVVGDGPRTVLLANGLGARLYTWQPVIEALAAQYRFITWDYRGLFDSASTIARRHLSVSDHAEDGMAILDAEGIDRAVLCGWSMGVQVSLETAMLYPERTAGLVLINGTYGHVFSSAFQPAFRLPFLPGMMHEGIDFVLDHPSLTAPLRAVAPWAAPFVGLGLAALAKKSPLAMMKLMRRYAREVFGEKTFTNYLRLFQEIDAHSTYHHLREIMAPALVISGALDTLTPAYQSREMLRRLHDAEALHIARGSHFVVLERPEIVVPAVAKFLANRARWDD